ncbi:hypothetical protein [Paenibacillus popilliae]|uniref:Non-ribosomal peptide synthetase module n=1 Tax=Paenibacillus popilliae ATCC 14706 TaxID=1212764 RepID=M9LQR4_PAEPP|nr:hypothetical protein [Paenibacillus popilliae]GAC43356.1 non-ribosomal peptide synthetase module [Paenibacillus popilliae ATCC 14706]
MDPANSWAFKKINAEIARKKALGKTLKKTPKKIPAKTSAKTNGKNSGKSAGKASKATANTGWDMVKGGSTIHGRRYSEHALERMAPNSLQVRAELEKRALERGFVRGTDRFNDFVKPRGIPPMVVEDVIKSVKPIPGKNPGTLDYIGNGIKVVTNRSGEVVTVFLSSGVR